MAISFPLLHLLDSSRFSFHFDPTVNPFQRLSKVWDMIGNDERAKLIACCSNRRSSSSWHRWQTLLSRPTLVTRETHQLHRFRRLTSRPTWSSSFIVLYERSSSWRPRREKSRRSFSSWILVWIAIIRD